MKYILALIYLVSSVLCNAEPLRIVVPFAPGGPNDQFARLLSSEIPGTVVENIVGAGGLVGAGSVAKTTKTEQTVVLHSDAIMISAKMSPEQLYTFPQDFSCIAEIGETYLVLYKAKKTVFPPNNSNTLSVADGGVGSTGNLTSTLIKRYLSMTLVSYRGAGPALNGFLAGDTDLLMEYSSPGVEYVQRGMIDIVAVTSAHRQKNLPAVPTMRDLGYTDVVVQPTLFVYSNINMSLQQKSILNQKINELMSSTRIAAHLARLNFKHTNYDLAQCNDKVNRIEKQWRDIVNSIK